MSAQTNRKTPPPLLMAGFEGKSLPPGLAAMLRSGKLLGVVLFSRNVEGPAHVRELCREIKAAAGGGRSAPMIAIDQEGGRVARLKDHGFTQFPPARCYSLFGGKSALAAEAAGSVIAAELAAVGVDINFAPVLDIDTNPRNPVIGDRALGCDAGTVSLLGAAFIRGTMSRGVIPVGKHFPGHGGTDADSHEELPVVRRGKKLLMARETLPFMSAMRAGVPALMTAHVLYTALDPEYPATLSRKIVTGLLREKLSFRGVVFSDALEMKAISRRHGTGPAAAISISAGCDAVLVCRGEEAQSEAVDTIGREWMDSADFRKAAGQAARRVERLRARLQAPAARRASLRMVGTKAHRALAELLSERWESSGRTSSDDRSDSIGER
jgi:beta-N-acetylhexosaminidase